MITTEMYSTIKKETRIQIRVNQDEQMKAQPQILGLRTIMSEGTDGIIKALSLKAD